MQQRESSEEIQPTISAVQIAKVVGVLAAGYLPLTPSATVIVWVHLPIGISLFLPPALGHPVAALTSGFAVGLVSGVLLGSRSILVTLVLAWIPIAFSWFITGYCRVSIGFESASGECHTVIVYSALLVMLLVSSLASVAGRALGGWFVRNRNTTQGVC